MDRSPAKQPATASRKVAQVVLCRGCCCGRTDRGKPDVPVDELKAIWKQRGLRKHVMLSVSGCLGPCDLHNVVLLMTEQGQTWLGELTERKHYDALVDWGSRVCEQGVDVPLPDILAEHRFERWLTEVEPADFETTTEE